MSRVSEFKLSSRNESDVVVTIAFERPTPVVRGQDIGALKNIFEGRRNREHRYPNIRRFEMVRTTLEYAESLKGTCKEMFNQGSDLNLVLRFESEENRKEFYEGIFDFVLKSLHDLNRNLKKRGLK